MNGFRMIVRNGASTNFFKDRWYNDIALIDLLSVQNISKLEDYSVQEVLANHQHSVWQTMENQILREQIQSFGI